MTPLHIELLLFHPGRNVAFGMPIFVGRNPTLLRRLLRGHGEWCGGPSVWAFRLSRQSVHLELRVGFNTRAGSRYARHLLPSIGTGWQLEKRCSHDVNLGLDAIRLDMNCASRVCAANTILLRVWLHTRGRTAEQVSAGNSSMLEAQKGYWFPCDGAVAIDVSDWHPVVPPPQTEQMLADFSRFSPFAPECDPLLVASLLARPGVIDILRERPECCFLFHATPFPEELERQKSVTCGQFRSEPFRHRGGRLIEANLCVPRIPAKGSVDDVR